MSETQLGIHGGGIEYTSGVTVSGTLGTEGSYTEITVTAGAPDLFAYCQAHSTMSGFGIATVEGSSPYVSSSAVLNSLEQLNVNNSGSANVYLLTTDDGVSKDGYYAVFDNGSGGFTAHLLSVSGGSWNVDYQAAQLLFKSMISVALSTVAESAVQSPPLDTGTDNTDTPSGLPIFGG